MSMRHGAHSSESDIISSELFLERALSSGGKRWSVDPGMAGYIWDKMREGEEIKKEC